MYLRLICALILILLTASTALADDDPETPWPVEENCVAEPTQPPDDWKFEGTIIATGWAGIHGMNTAWDVPHVLAFRDGWISEGGYGSLSPDGRWYAVPQATFRPGSDSIYAGYVDVTRLLVYDVMDGQNILQVEWEDTYELFFGSGPSRYFTFRTPVWFDEDTIVYQRGETYYFVHVPDLEMEEWAYPSEWQEVSPVWVFVSHPSPDWSRIVERGRLFNTETNEFKANVYMVADNIDYPRVAWHPESAEFIISGGLSTTMFDNNGNLIDVISSASEGETNNFTSIRESAYAPDGNLFWLFVNSDGPTYTGRWNVALADQRHRTIVDTCIDSRVSAQFSPDGRYLAFLSYESGQQELLIFDVESWQLYKTGIFHEGEIIGWHED